MDGWIWLIVLLPINLSLQSNIYDYLDDNTNEKYFDLIDELRNVAVKHFSEEETCSLPPPTYSIIYSNPIQGRYLLEERSNIKCETKWGKVFQEAAVHFPFLSLDQQKKSRRARHVAKLPEKIKETVQSKVVGLHTKNMVYFCSKFGDWITFPSRPQSYDDSFDCRTRNPYQRSSKKMPKSNDSFPLAVGLYPFYTTKELGLTFVHQIWIKGTFMGIIAFDTKVRTVQNVDKEITKYNNVHYKDNDNEEKINQTDVDCEQPMTFINEKEYVSYEVVTDGQCDDRYWCKIFFSGYTVIVIGIISLGVTHWWWFNFKTLQTKKRKEGNNIDVDYIGGDNNDDGEIRVAVDNDEEENNNDVGNTSALMKSHEIFEIRTPDSESDITRELLEKKGCCETLTGFKDQWSGKSFKDINYFDSHFSKKQLPIVHYLLSILPHSTRGNKLLVLSYLCCEKHKELRQSVMRFIMEKKENDFFNNWIHAGLIKERESKNVQDVWNQLKSRDPPVELEDMDLLPDQLKKEKENQTGKFELKKLIRSPLFPFWICYLIILVKVMHSRIEFVESKYYDNLFLGIFFARIGADMIKIAFVIQILLMTCKRLYSNKLASYCPNGKVASFVYESYLQYHVKLHKIVGLLFFVWCTFHSLFHIFNFYKILEMPSFYVEEIINTRLVIRGISDLLKLRAVYTGGPLLFITILITLTSYKGVIQSNYEIFKSVHYLSILFMTVLMIMHGLDALLKKPTFYLYSLVLLPYLIGFISSFVRRKMLKVIESELHGSKVRSYKFETDMKFIPGQYISVSLPYFNNSRESFSFFKNLFAHPFSVFSFDKGSFTIMVKNAMKKINNLFRSNSNNRTRQNRSQSQNTISSNFTEENRTSSYIHKVIMDKIYPNGESECFTSYIVNEEQGCFYVYPPEPSVTMRARNHPNTILLAVGSVGITPFTSLVLGEVAEFSYLHLIWTLSSIDELLSYRCFLEELSKQSKVKVNVHITQATANMDTCEEAIFKSLSSLFYEKIKIDLLTDTPIETLYGRPDYGDYLRELDVSIRELAIVVCGANTESVLASVSNHIKKWSSQLKGRKVVLLNEPIFA